MHINQIKISGFKSFAEDVELILEPGVTTIVGPNGCGKSNVSDAIRWLLGQQSPRALRCANMQDLLFNGGSNFKPAQRAQASLHFTNVEGKLALESPEIAVRRQLTRSGESEYFINDAPCLLRDITELFMDTGIGVDAYSVMEQSKIDLILNTRPEERRFLFDEVAGITKYKHRKKTAIKKLEATEQNLVRINDVIHTVQRETESLKRQAEQAKRHQQLHGQLRNLELDLSRREHGRFAKDLTQTQLNLDELMLAVTEANEQIDSTEQQIEDATARRAELDNLIRDGQGVVSRFASEIEQTERQIALYKERQLNIQQQRQRALQAIESLEKQSAEFEAQKEEREQEHRQVDVSLQLEESRLTARRRVLTALDTRVTETESSVEAAQENLLETRNQVSQLETQLASLNNKLEYSAANLDRITERSNALGTELETEKASYTKARRREQQLNADLIRLETDQQKAEEDIQRYQTELRKLESEMRGMQDSLGTSASRFKSLRDLQAAHEGYYTGVRAILKVRETEPERFGGICGVIAELIRTEPDYELAIEVALGSAIQNIVTKTAEDAQSGIEFLKRTKAGRVTFLPLDILRTRPFHDYDPKYEVAVQQLLGNTVVVEDLDTAIKLTRRSRHSARLVTLEGELINTSGAVTGGHNTSSTSGLLSRSRELESLQERINQLTNQLNEKDTRSKKLAGKLAELQQTRQTLITQGQTHQIEHASLSKVLEQGQRQISQLEEQLSDVEKEEVNLHQETEKAKADQDALQSELEKAAKTRRTLQRRIERLSEQIQSEKSKREEVIESCQELEIALAGKREKLQSLSSELLNLQKNQAQIRESIGEHQAVIDSDDQTRQELSSQIDEAQRKFLQIEQEKFEAEENVRRLEEEHIGLIEQIAEAQKLMRKARREFDKHNRLRHHLEVTTTQLQMQLKAIAARILDKYQITIDQIEIEENPVDDLELMGQIDTLKTEIEEMGAVNLVAIEEYEEHKQREDFLVTQREDLERSLESVNQAIQKINRTSRETFLQAFEQIRANFQEVFEELFGGGETELRLIDESDVLESGIDIIACPPGKRPQSITQLSGGERSLVAIALLFAVFKIKPSPFCVLDEVDAALDEANVLRFTNLIRKYAQQTQFIIITHNKRTMEIADVMYGVTMEQAGLSKVVSAKFGNKIAA
ncbi:Chromosome partition protein Smc [Geodia barretti]|uniref:Chromosome partition protein Smc n=1 Tax=Geodia barretti TaxID=519541 RepID=A0AA35RGW0_GEOBA|nr:Chromosome partition protein Smc [Geodia barretti]